MDQAGKKPLRERFQCPKDHDPNYENTTWCNRDLIPIPRQRRTYGFISYMAYWTVSGSNISAWTVGSTMLAFGLTPQQAIAVIVVAGIITGLLAVACGWMGAKQHIGYTVCSRFSWGMRGSYFPVILRVFIASIFFGMQAFWDGQAARVCLGAVIPGLEHLPNYFSASSHLETKDFIGLIIWMCAFVPAILIRPERLQIPFAVCFLLFCCTIFGLLIWSVSQAHGPGAMFHEPGTAPNVGWALMFSLTAILGAWGGGTLGQSDWTRYATTPMAPVPSQLIASPLTITVTAVIGIVVTSAARDILGGDVIWNPIYLLAAMQEYYGSSSAVRAGVFFGGLGLVASQLAISVVLNAMSCGMDMAGLWPRYINIRRGAAIMAVIGIAIQPWQLLATASKFLQVLSGFGVFLAPLTGIMLADYHVIRQRKLKVNHLYRGDSSSIYWYNNGFNWRAPVAFFMGAWPMLPGLVASVDALKDPTWVAWIRLYHLTFIAGLAISFVVFLALNLAFPPPGLGEEAKFEAINGSRAVSFDGPRNAQLGGHHGQQQKTAPVAVV